MARPNKMWWWGQVGEYAVTVRGKRHRLGTDEEEATRKFHAILATRPEEPVKAQPGTVAELIDRFFEEEDWKSEETQGWYLKHCQSFIDFLKSETLAALKVADLAPYHVKNWLRSHTNWSDTTKNGACRAVQRAFRWANQMGYIKVNPIAFIPGKPSPERRENVITPAEYEKLRTHVLDEDFLDLLTVSWECGSRPQESLRVEKRHFDADNQRWEFPVGEGKKTRKKAVRYVYLTANAMAITRRRCLKYPEGPIFRNTDGNPWTTYAVACRFSRLEKHIGRKLALYDFRHSFTERLRQSGVDSINIAALLGHADLSMLGRTYAHPHTHPEHLLKLLNGG